VPEQVYFIMDEILNIDYHRFRLVLKSLNSSATIAIAADKCGVNKRTMFNYMKQYSIFYSKEEKKYLKL